MISRRLHQLLHEAGWSLDLVALVEGGAQEAEQIMEDRSVKAVTITGSAVAGTAAQKICGRRGIPLQAELGGNNAAIVWDDADLPEAVRQITAGAFEMAGQRCTANRRVIVADTCRDEFLRLLIDETARLSWGHPLDVQTRVGPLVDPGQRDRVAATVARAIDAGGPGFVPHGRAQPSAEGHDGAWYPPTILCRDEPHHEIVQEETFGPVLVVQTARCWAEAITLCNGVRQGLAAAVFTRSRAIAHRFLEQAEAGILKINQSTADAAVDVPFGGWKASGVGLPEHGVFDREFYTRPQTVYASAGEELGCATIIATSRIDKPFPHSSSSKPHSVPNTSLSTRDFGGRPTVS
jgi:acyl-CoA reductase-like NAD-dependent aldehyde dehydrogenase